ncbi:MAG: ImcF-related family protein [Bryobacteraceae bacterium]
MLTYVVAGLVFVVYALLVWLLTGRTSLAGSDLLVLRIGLWVIGLAVTIVAVFLVLRRRARTPARVADAPEEVSFLVREANQRLAESAKLRADAGRVADLPVVLVIGETGTTKTSVVVNSGLQPELLAGRDRADTGAIPPTRGANLWLGAGTVLVEAAGNLLNSEALRGLADQIRPAQAAAVFGRRQAPRAVVICIDLETLQRPDAAATGVAVGKKFNALLGDIGQIWGARLPVYVLFTKFDRIPYFNDYVRVMGREEATQVFGAAFPMEAAAAGGSYNQQRTAELNAAWETLFSGLAEKRSEHLRRENDTRSTPNIYEFPREFRKLRDNAVRCLLEIGRPRQLRATPFLRGMFFTGVRPVVLEDRSGAAPRRVPQWVFLEKFFSDALLGDRLALNASGANQEAGVVQRVLLGTLAAACLLWFGGATVSFLKNRTMIAESSQAAAALSAVRTASGQPATLDALERLERLRVPAENVTRWEAERPPMSHRWGVYPGRPMHDAIRDAYCRSARSVVLDDVREQLTRRLRSVPRTPGPQDDYDQPYSYLKAYLMMTRYPDKADAAYLTRVLGNVWADRQALSPDQTRLAREQFRFYASARKDNFCDARADEDAIRQTQAYLWQFKLVDRVYRNMLDEVAAKGQPIRFADPTGAVSDPREVSHAFTRTGFALMQTAIQKAPDYVNREPWVLGEGQAVSNVPPGEVIAQLRDRYQEDFVGQWNQFLNAGRVERYGGFPDAAKKLSSTASPGSPLLRLFCLISTHTDVDNPAIKKPFEPIQGLVAPASCESAAIGPNNERYMGELAALQVGVDRIANSSNRDAERLGEADTAKKEALMTAQKLNLPQKAAQLLQDPILYAEAMMKGVPVSAANSKGAGFCSDLAPVLSKYPFNPRSSTQARPDDLAAVFQPGSGRLFTFYQEALAELLTPVGSRYTAKTDGPVKVNPGFVAFYNKAIGLANMFFPAGATQPQVHYTLQVVPSADIEDVYLQIDKQLLKGSSRGGSQDFTWPDGGAGVRLRVRAKEVQPPELPLGGGVWSVVQFFARADRVTGGAGRALLEYDLRNTASIGKVASVERAVPLKLVLDMKGAPSSLLPRDLQLSCVSSIAAR